MKRFKQFILEEEKPVKPVKPIEPVVSEPIKDKKKPIKPPLKKPEEPTNVDIS
tara:strand:+ start:3953 stop:4111 length:159 start_codon:yes stop_codon:yes gene_type:complete